MKKRIGWIAPILAFVAGHGARWVGDARAGC